MGRIYRWPKPRGVHRRRQADKGLSNLSVVAIGLLLGAILGGGILLYPGPTQATGAKHFDSCEVGGGINCVVDGDTFWMDGEKIRVADIDAPETHPPRCAYEGQLGNRATQRLRDLLNQGPIELRAADRDTDKYGRKLRIVYRDGQSLGGILVAEGLARQWTGSRQPWC